MILKKRSPFFEVFKKYAFVIGFLSISLIHFAIFWVYINFDTIRLTFYSFDPMRRVYFWNNFQNYKNLLENIFDPVKRDIFQVNSFKNTFRALIINIIIFPLALIVAYAFYKKIPGTKTFRVIFYLPSIVSIVILCTAYKAMLRAETGPVWLIAQKLGCEREFLADLKTVWPFIYFFCIINGMGTNVILMASSMLRIPNEISESSRLDGCGFFRELFYITVPCIMPTITTWMTMIFTSVFGFYIQPMLLAPGIANGITSTIPMQIFQAAEAGSSNVNALIGAATSGIFLSVFMLPWVLIMRFVMKKLTPEVTY